MTDLMERLNFHATRVEECGHLNAARYIRYAIDELALLRTLLKPFADCVLDDCDGVTVRSSKLEIGDFVAAARGLGEGKT